MKFKTFFLFVCLCSSFTFAYTLADAERAYVNRDWNKANAAYAEVCPTLTGDATIACSYWKILALSQTGKASEFQKARTELDSLLQKISPRDTLYSDLVITRAQFEIYLKQYAKAKETILHAKETSKDSVNLILHQVCDLLKTKDGSEETKTFCESLKESKSSDSTTVANVNSTEKIDSTKTLQEKSSLTEIATNKDSVAEIFALQLGAFSKKENAEALVLALKSRGIKTTVVERITKERTLYLVHSSTFFSRDEAMNYGEKTLAPLNLEFSLVKKD